MSEANINIPPDVLRAAQCVAADLPSRVMEANRAFAALVIARAILAEREAQRERDAVLVESYWAGSGTIANAIRKGAQ